MSEHSLTTHRAAKYCDVTVPAVIRWVNEGKLKAYKTPGGHRRIAPEDLVDFMRKYGFPIVDELTGFDKIKILIVDDDEESLAMMCRALEKYAPKFIIETAREGFEAGQKSISFHPKVVILDLNLPGVDGIRICQNLRAKTATQGIKILAVTGFGSDEIRDRVMACGADGFLSKPVAPALLGQEIRRVLNLNEDLTYRRSGESHGAR